ncbi:hypothetical protein F0562_009369 [Nyssa sinensis]|uniref:Uncharacterized protein n=1 Tax=Nyssa sinensis TaxID=561372 RepID=A0A5J4ZVY7_9ASTE|nr:hypothetical protein F0562_009369 [Nyssa sinensis]
MILRFISRMRWWCFSFVISGKRVAVHKPLLVARGTARRWPLRELTCQGRVRTARRNPDKGLRQPDKRVRYADLGLRRSDEGLWNPDKTNLGCHLSDAFSEGLQSRKFSEEERKYSRRISKHKENPYSIRRWGFDGQGLSKNFSVRATRFGPTL